MALDGQTLGLEGHLTTLGLQNQLDAEQSQNKSLKVELENEKMKNQGMQMLFDCMQEVHAENQQLKNLVKRHKLMLCKIKKRLHMNQNSDILMNWDDLSDSSDGEDNPDSGRRSLKSRLHMEDKENLAIENIGTESKVCKGDVEQLNKQVRELISENEQLTNHLTSSGTEKDAEILKMKKQLHELEKSQKISAILFDSLSEEALTLKRHLAETVRMCQKLLQTLEMKHSCSTRLTSNMAETASSDNTQSLHEDKALSIVKEQYANLEAKLKEVVTMNSRWQQYNEQREEYVQQVLQRNVELEQALINRGHQMSQAQQERFDQILIENKQKLDLAVEEKIKLDKENQMLKANLSEVRLSLKRSSLEVQELQKKLQANNLEYSKAVRSQMESNEALKLQVQQFQEDFESERKDRERAHAHISQLESQIRTATQQLSLNNMHPNPEQVRPFHERQYVQTFPQEASLVGRGGHFTVNSEGRSDSDELDLRPTD